MTSLQCLFCCKQCETSWPVAAVQRLVSFGITDLDSFEVQRQKKLLMIFLLLAIGLIPIFLTMLLWCGMPRAAVVSTLVFAVPMLLTLGLYVSTRKVALCGWTVICCAIVCTTLIILFCGGIRNSGYVPYVHFPVLLHLCLTRNCKGATVLFVATTGLLTAIVAVEPALFRFVVKERQWVPEMEDTFIRWYWWFHNTLLNLGLTVLFGYLLHNIAPQLDAYEQMERRLDELARRLVRLDLEGIPEPSSTASALEKQLFEVVSNMRQWKPYIPATLFLRDDSASASSEEGSPVAESPLVEAVLPDSTGAVEPKSPTLFLRVTTSSTTDEHAAKSQVSIQTSSAADAVGGPDSKTLCENNVSTLNSAGSSVTVLKFRRNPKLRRGSRNVGSCAEGDRSRKSPEQPGEVSELGVFTVPQSSASPDRDTAENLQGSMGRTTDETLLNIPVPSNRKRPGAGMGTRYTSQRSRLTSAVGHNVGLSLRLMLKHTTVAAFSMARSLRIDESGIDSYRTACLFLDTVNDHMKELNGAIHQFFGDLAICVWTGGAQQLRACNAASEISRVLLQRFCNRGQRCAVAASVASGLMLVGNVGHEHRMPVFHGPAQATALQLNSLCGLLRATVLVESTTAVEVNEHFDVLPADVIQFGAVGSSPDVVFEILPRDTSDAPSNPASAPFEDQYLHCYRSAFALFRSGQLRQAHSLFLDLSDTSLEGDVHCPTPSSGGASTSRGASEEPGQRPCSSQHSHSVIQRHSSRLALACADALSSEEPNQALVPTRRWEALWASSYSRTAPPSVPLNDQQSFSKLEEGSSETPKVFAGGDSPALGADLCSVLGHLVAS
eukprot:RCo027731